jgi:hypothetical protein
MLINGNVCVCWPLLQALLDVPAYELPQQKPPPA